MDAPDPLELGQTHTFTAAAMPSSTKPAERSKPSKFRARVTGTDQGMRCEEPSGPAARESLPGNSADEPSTRPQHRTSEASSAARRHSVTAHGQWFTGQPPDPNQRTSAASPPGHSPCTKGRHAVLPTRHRPRFRDDSSRLTIQPCRLRVCLV